MRCTTARRYSKASASTRRREAQSGFRLTDHVHRLYDSAKIYRMKIPYTRDVLVGACRDVVRENGLLQGAYIRPIAFRGYGEMGVAGNIDQPANVSIAAWEWGSYLGEGGLEQGVDVCVSSWQRVAPNTVPALAKAGGNYLVERARDARGAPSRLRRRALRSARTAT